MLPMCNSSSGDAEEQEGDEAHASFWREGATAMTIFMLNGLGLAFMLYVLVNFLKKRRKTDAARVPREWKGFNHYTEAR